MLCKACRRTVREQHARSKNKIKHRRHNRPRITARSLPASRVYISSRGRSRIARTPRKELDDPRPRMCTAASCLEAPLSRSVFSFHGARNNLATPAIFSPSLSLPRSLSLSPFLVLSVRLSAGPYVGPSVCFPFPRAGNARTAEAGV